MILAIDPGTVQSGWCMYGDKAVIGAGVEENRAVLGMVKEWREHLAIEMIASYGMAVGREVFETVLWIGRMTQAYHNPDDVRLVYRRDVKIFLCGNSTAKDPNVRQATIDLFAPTGGGKVPQVGVKKQPGPLFGVSSHAWSALAVAITAEHQINFPRTDLNK